jgi:FAD synthase
MHKTNTLTIRVPAELKERIENTALLQGVSINQFALYAFTKELAELEHSRYFTRFLKGKKKEDIIKGFDAVMEKIQARPPEDWDRLE